MFVLSDCCRGASLPLALIPSPPQPLSSRRFRLCCIGELNPPAGEEAVSMTFDLQMKKSQEGVFTSSSLLLQHNVSQCS